MRGEFVAGAIGQGLNSFMDSYLQAQDIQRKKAESDDERSMKRRAMQLQEKEAGVEWNPETNTYKDTESFMSTSERKKMSGLLEAQKAAGENWYRKEYSPMRTALNTLLQRAYSGGGELPANGAMPGAAATPTGGGLLSRQPESTVTQPMAPARPAASGLMPRAVKPGLQTSAPQQNLSPYELAARQAEKTPVIGFNQNEWAPGFLPKDAKAQIQKNAEKASEIRAKGIEQDAIPQQKMQTQLAESIANQAGIASSIREGLSQLEDPKIPEDQKIIIGREMLKTLNSQQGKDAVGAEEAARLGGLLDYHLGNFAQPGPFWGRDVPGFTQQVRNNLSRLQKSIGRNEGLLKRAKSGQSLVGDDKAKPDFSKMSESELKQYVGQ